MGEGLKERRPVVLVGATLERPRERAGRALPKRLAWNPRRDNNAQAFLPCLLLGLDQRRALGVLLTGERHEGAWGWVQGGAPTSGGEALVILRNSFPQGVRPGPRCVTVCSQWRRISFLISE